MAIQLVFAETVTFLRRRAGWRAARKVGEAILRSRVIEVVGLSDEQLHAAWRELVRSGDPKLSLCDATSFVLMRERGISHVLTFDRHFAESGFDLLPWWRTSGCGRDTWWVLARFGCPLEHRTAPAMMRFDEVGDPRSTSRRNPSTSPNTSRSTDLDAAQAICSRSECESSWVFKI